MPPIGPLTPAITGSTAVDAPGTGVVGVFGFAGPAKGTELIAEVLRSLPASYTRLELVGSGWGEVRWPEDITGRLEVALLGFVASADLGPVFARWELAIAPFSRTRMPASVVFGNLDALKIFAAPWQFSQASGTPPGIGTGCLYSAAPAVGLPACASAEPLNPTTASAATAGGSDRR